MGLVHFLNVKDGDCTIIEHTSGRVSMIDICNGNPENKQPVIDSYGLMESILESLQGNRSQKSYPVNPIDYLHSLNIKNIHRFILTHPDMDHLDGLKRLYTEFSVKYFWDTDNNKQMSSGSLGSYNADDWKFYQEIRKTATKYCADFKSGVFASIITDKEYGKDFLQILCPTRSLNSEANKSGNYNNCSYVILYKEANQKILFCGDSEEKEWDILLNNYPQILKNIDVLIAPHHGRKSGGNDNFLDVLKPKLTLFGNAKSQYLNYNDWNNRGLKHFTNNQGGSFILEHRAGKIEVYCTNQQFAEAFTKEKRCNTHRHIKYNAWYLDRV